MSGRLAAVAVSATTETTVYTVPALKVATCTLSLCNRTSDNITVRVAIATSATATTGEWIEYGATLPGNGVLERSALVLDATQRLNIYASAAGVSAVVYGFEE